MAPNGPDRTPGPVRDRLAQSRVVGVTALVAAVEGRGVGLGERAALLEPLRQVRVGDEERAERHRVSDAVLDQAQRVQAGGVRVGEGVQDERTLPLLAQLEGQAAYYGDGFFVNNLFGPMNHFTELINLYRERYAHYGHGTQAQAIVGAGGHVFVRKNSQDAVREYRPYFDNSPVYGGGPSMEQYMAQTSLTVGSPQEVIDKTLSFREHFGDYQRQLFNIDMAGLPLKTVLEQLDLLGEEVLPTLRKEFASVRPSDVAEAPTHASLLAARSEEAAK